MQYKQHKVTDLKIAYIGGGSRGWAWTFMTDLSLEENLGGTIRLYDIDREAAEHNKVIGTTLSNRPEIKGHWNYEVVSTLEEALSDTDFVIISILPGTFDEMESDVHLPEKYGIYQSVGDTAGPGGIVRALRTIPMFVTIANAIKEFAPNAWVINYTNPMSLCVKALYHTFPEIKAFGCCHEVFGTQEVLKKICEDTFKLNAIKRSDIHVNVLGINHFTWFDEASYEGIDLFPVYQDYIQKHYEEGFIDEEKPWEASTFNCAHRVKFDLFNRFHMIAAAGDRHLAEFMPGNEYLKNPQTIRDWKFHLTPVAWRKNDLAERLSKSERLRYGEEQVELKASGEEGILLIKALCGLGRLVSNVNIPNTHHQILNLDEHAIVETNAVFERNSIKPIVAGSIKEDVLKLVEPHLKNHELVLEGALTCKKAPVLKAFLNDPLIKDRISKEDAEKLLDEMIANTLTYLPAAWKDEIASCYNCHK